MVGNIGKPISSLEGDWIEDGPPLGPGCDIGEPVAVADGGGGEVVSGGVGRKDDLGDPPAPVGQRRQSNLGGGDGVEEVEHALLAAGEGEPSAAGANAPSPQADGLELEGAARRQRGGRGPAPGGVEDDEEGRGKRQECTSPRRAGPPRAGVELEVEPVADAAEELRRQILPAPERRHGGGWVLCGNSAQGLRHLGVRYSPEFGNDDPYIPGPRHGIR